MALTGSNVAVGSVAAVTIGAAVYINNRVNEIELRVAQMEKLLAGIVPRVDPNIGPHLRQCVAGIRSLEGEIQALKAQNLDPIDLKVKTNVPVIVESDLSLSKSKAKKYTRLTKSNIPEIKSSKMVESDDEDIEEALALLEQR